MRLIIYTCIFILGLSAGATAQEATGEINKAIRGGDATTLSDHFNSSLDISIPGTDQTMSRAHATQVIKKFFSENPPKSYKVNHIGSSREATKYIIGTYTSGIISYKTYALLKLNDGEYRIVQLQFELE